MVYLVDTKGNDLLFTFGLFGVQHETFTAEKHTIISTLYDLLSESAGIVDQLQDESHGLDQKTVPSTVFASYWLRSKDYEAWFSCEKVQAFWRDLPEDAGVWREVMTVPGSRYMFAANQAVPWGLALLLDIKESMDQGYWGVYRHRLGSTTDTFTSPYVLASKAKGNGEKPSITIPESYSKTIRLGRVRVSNVPNNLCFAREGQRQPDISTGEERELWLDQVAPHVQSWMEHLDTEPNQTGVMSFTTHTAHESPETSEHKCFSSTGVPPTNDVVAQTDQLVYFLDLAHFEHAGRAHRGHVQLRKTVMDLYNPAGKLSHGKAQLFVELFILKSEDLDAEYIGCAEGTGLMYLESS